MEDWPGPQACTGKAGSSRSGVGRGGHAGWAGRQGQGICAEGGSGLGNPACSATPGTPDGAVPMGEKGERRPGVDLSRGLWPGSGAPRPESRMPGPGVGGTSRRNRPLPEGCAGGHAQDSAHATAAAGRVALLSRALQSLCRLGCAVRDSTGLGRSAGTRLGAGGGTLAAGVGSAMPREGDKGLGTGTVWARWGAGREGERWLLLARVNIDPMRG